MISESQISLDDFTVLKVIGRGSYAKVLMVRRIGRVCGGECDLLFSSLTFHTTLSHHHSLCITSLCRPLPSYPALHTLTPSLCTPTPSPSYSYSACPHVHVTLHPHSAHPPHCTPPLHPLTLCTPSRSAPLILTLCMPSHVPLHPHSAVLTLHILTLHILTLHTSHCTPHIAHFTLHTLTIMLTLCMPSRTCTLAP